MFVAGATNVKGHILCLAGQREIGVMVSLRICANNIGVLQLNTKSRVRALGAEKYKYGFKLKLSSHAQVSG